MKNSGFADRIDEFHQAAIAAFRDNAGRAMEGPEGKWDDFGGDEYHAPLQQLLASLDANKPTTALNATIMEQMIVGTLKGRLYSEYYKKRNPGYRHQAIVRPIFIIGLPRSGTTALHKMLTADPNNQGLQYWLGQTPMPRPEPADWPSINEYRACAEYLSMLETMAPDMFEIHEMAADQADECRLLLMQSFANVSFQSSAWMPEYEEWLYGADLTEVYQRYKANLQLIGLGDSRQWILKDPSHLWSPKTVLETFPDACIVQTHRHPRALVPSVSSLVYSSRKMTEPDIDKSRVGRRELKQWARVLNNLAAFRDRQNDLPIFDVYMEDLQRDPLQTIEDIYQFFDLPFNDASRQAIASWSVSRPAPPQGAHRYSAEQFGLTDQLIDEQFGDYIATLRQ